MSDYKKTAWSSVVVQIFVIAIVLGVLGYALVPLSKAFLSKNEVQGKTAVSQEALTMYERDIKTQEERLAKIRSESNRAELETERVKDLLREENIKLEQAKGELTKTIDLRKAASADQNRFAAIQTNLQSTNDILRIAIRTMEGKIDLMKIEMSNISSNVAVSKATVKKQQIEEESNSKKIESLKSNILALNQELALHQKNVADGKKEYLENEEKLRNSLVTLKEKEADLAQIKTELAAIEKTKSDLETEVNDLKAAIVGSQAQSELLKKKTSDETGALKVAQVNLDLVRADCVTKNSQLDQLENEIALKTKERDAMVIDQASKKQTLDETDKRLISAKEGLAKESESLRSVKADVDEARAEYVSYKGQLEQIMKQINSKKKELAAIEEK